MKVHLNHFCLHLLLPFIALIKGQELNGPIYHVSETTYIKLSDIFNDSIRANSQFYSPQVADQSEGSNLYTPGVSFTQGGPVSSRIADLGPNSTCTGYMISSNTNSVGLVCENQSYLLDLNTYSRSQSIRLENPDQKFRSFSTSSYSMLYLSSNSDRTCIEGYYLNTFDSSYKHYPCTQATDYSLVNFAGYMFELKPTLKYLTINTTKFILVFDGQENAHSQANGHSSTFFLRKSDPSGGPGYNTNLAFKLFDKIEQAEINGKVTFLDILVMNSEEIIFLYKVKGEKNLKVSSREIAASETLTPIWKEEKPITHYSISVDWMGNLPAEQAWTGKREKFMARHIMQEFIMIFYPDLFELVVCKVLTSTSSIGDCNKTPLSLSQFVPNFERYTITGSSMNQARLPGANVLRFFVEIKHKETMKTEMSFSILRVENQGFSLYKENEWRIPGDLHVIDFNAADSSVRVLRGKTVETYPSVMKYVKFNFKEYFKNKTCSFL